MDIQTYHVEPTEDSFGILFDDRYGGKISWVDTSNMMYIGGLFLGVPDPFDMTDEELAEVRDFLASKKHLVKFMWNQSYDFWLSFKRRRSGSATRGRTHTKRRRRWDELPVHEPKEGRVSWVCGMGLAKDTPNYFHAHEYVDSWASKKAAKFLLAGTTTVTRTPRRPVDSSPVWCRRWGSTTRRSSIPRKPRVLHPATGRLPAVLERGAGVLSQRTPGPGSGRGDP